MRYRLLCVLSVFFPVKIVPGLWMWYGPRILFTMYSPFIVHGKFIPAYWIGALAEEAGMRRYYGMYFEVFYGLSQATRAQWVHFKMAALRRLIMR